MLNIKSNPPLSLYIHLPWCVKKCPYCDFNSHEVKNNNFQEEKYVKALIKDLEFELPRIWGRSIISVFIGGGTPSLFSANAMETLLSALRARLTLHPELEITLEANPGTADADNFKAYREMGINRLSVGVQSFSNAKLNCLGRIHNSEEAITAVEIAHESGFKEINLDLMFGLPDQTIEEATNDIQQAIALKPTHLSWYQLTIEPNTVFYAKPPVLPDDDTLWEMQQQGQNLLTEHGYQQYEISAYAKNKHQCLHNTNYWQFGDYLGLGAGAHSKITDVSKGQVNRFTRQRIPNSFLQKAGTEDVITESRSLTQNDIPLEFMMNTLRLKEGFHPSIFLDRTGLPISHVEAQLEQAEQKGLIQWDIEKIKPTELGQRYLNDLLQLFMPMEKVNRAKLSV